MTAKPRRTLRNAYKGKTRRAHGLGLEFMIWNFAICSGASLAVCRPTPRRAWGSMAVLSLMGVGDFLDGDEGYWPVRPMTYGRQPAPSALISETLAATLLALNCTTVTS